MQKQINASSLTFLVSLLFCMSYSKTYSNNLFILDIHEWLDSISVFGYSSSYSSNDIEVSVASSSFLATITGSGSGCGESAP
jgi:hypothetical protein